MLKGVQQMLLKYKNPQLLGSADFAQFQYMSFNYLKTASSLSSF
jgi:hypothetical protein